MKISTKIIFELFPEKSSELSPVTKFNVSSPCNSYQCDFYGRSLIGSGTFGDVYKAVKRIEGIFYAIKISREKINRRSVAKMRQLNREICALSFLGKCNENLIRYYSSWIEERVYLL